MYPIATNLQVVRIPWVTYGMVTANGLIHLAVTWDNGFVIPNEIVRAGGFAPGSFGSFNTSHRLVVCQFLHGDLFHLSANMLFLLVFGRPVEAVFGRINFLFLYMTAGIAACLAHAITEPGTTKSLIGASGAISGVLGSFLIANPRARITLILDPILVHLTRRFLSRVPAWLFLIAWLFLQLGLALRPSASNIAFWAHIGGFMCGCVVTCAILRYLSRARISIKT